MTEYSPGNHASLAALRLQDSIDGCRRRRAQPRPAAAICPIRDMLGHLGGKWTVLVVIALSTGTRRFSELRRELPKISQRVLTQTLRDLERSGLVQRQLHAAVPPRVDYRLSPLGVSLLEPLAGLIDWAGRNKAALSSARAAFEAGEAAAAPFACPHRA